MCESDLHPATNLLSTTPLLKLPFEDNNCALLTTAKEEIVADLNENGHVRSDMPLLNTTSKLLKSEGTPEVNVSTYT